ncbi:pyrimidine-nucleoside phosphorylase [Tumebacillus sp. ITR2]|uniref:Pyrimidine-nucleoside phosphorylase n=1 Tax=Tumebacillus amylolyticus TaxID=2801339 RepID=A0ABS1JBA3_9BACL|nr:pyrimidine-nucleoside phosphorylase [Tumebacillus amylolyticus]MBL0387561.1 pyrimidine-nucleoside phosphorylase [Tumebacillus amylolyticus]
MRMYDIIHKKRDGEALTQAEIDFVIKGFTDGSIPDYQMAALSMAIFLRGMSPEETAHLTLAMAASGDQIDLSQVQGVKVDKHSTGGVGDTTTLVLLPLVASVGVPVAKMSGRGLGHTGGTIDKLESIPGFSIERTKEQFIEQVNTKGAALMGQSGSIAPADKKLYALRDVTATVDCIPLISSSIMSKKIAAGADAIVLDVKTGEGAFMKTLDGSFALAEAMVNIGENVGRHTIGVISDMDQPLGFAIGNALEVQEAIDTLKGHGPADLTELCLVLGSYMVVAAGGAATAEEAREKLTESLSSGRALETFKTFLRAQGGDASLVDEPTRLPQAAKKIPVTLPRTGFVSRIHAEEVGTSAMLLGAGRETKESEIDLAVGIVLHKKVGDRVEAGEAIATLYVNDERKVAEVTERLQAAYELSETEPPQHRLIFGVVTQAGTQRFA